MLRLVKALIGLGRRRAFLNSIKHKIDKGTKIKWAIQSRNPHSGCELWIGTGTILEGRVVFETDRAIIRIGKNSFIGAGTALISSSLIEIGDDVLISWGVTIVDHNSHSIIYEERVRDVEDWFIGVKNWTHVKRASVRIENGAWIGFNSIILKGVTIGARSIVAAGAVVTKNVPPDVIVGGNPAKIIRYLSVNEQ